MDPWTFVWLGWLGLFLVFELTAVLLHKPTLSQKTWDWFSLSARKRWWLARRVVFLVFWLSLGIGHFLLGGPALWSVILPGIPFGAVIVYAVFFEKDRSEKQGMEWPIVTGQPFPHATNCKCLLCERKLDEGAAPAAEGGVVGWLKKVWGALKGGTGWMLKRGPLWSALLVGAATVIPGAAPILKMIAAAIAGVSGGSVDQATAQTAGEVIAGLLLLVGAVRKFWALAKPQLS